MRKTTVGTLVASLVLTAGLVPAANAGKAKKKKPKVPAVRSLDLSYANPAVGTSGVGACNACPTFVTTDSDNYLTAESADATFPTAHLQFTWDTNGDGNDDTGFTVCGATTEPVELPEATTITVWPWAAPGVECSTGASSTGTVSLTLSETATHEGH